MSCHVLSCYCQCGFAAHRTNRRTGRGGGRCPPIRAVCRNTFGQRVDIIRAKHNIYLNNTNLGSVTAANGTNFATLPPPPNRARNISATTPTEYGSRKILVLPPPTELIRAKLGLPPPPKWMLARTPMIGPRRRHQGIRYGIQNYCSWLQESN